MSKIKIYCDSACDLSIEECKEIGVEMISLSVNIKDKDYSDRIDITPAEFYEMLKEDGVMPRTSMVSPQRFIEIFEKDIEEENDIICISLSSGISGSYNSSVLAKNTMEYDGFYPVDSLGASGGIGMMVRKAASMRDEGKSAKEIVQELDFMREKTRYLFCPGSLEMLRRGGRISSAKAAIGSILKIKPIFNFEDGKIMILSKVRGEKAFVKFCMNHIQEHGFNKDYQFAIGHANNPKIVELLKKSIKNEYGMEDVPVFDIGAVIGSHTGEGTVAFFYIDN